VQYIDVQWMHQDSEEPVRLISELDERRHELRKLEFFATGEVGFASSAGTSVDTRLGTEPVPTIEHINAQPEFNGVLMDMQTFNALWRLHAGDAE